MENQHKTTRREIPLSMQKILSTWLPLVGSWLMMSIERPILNAVLARLADPEIHIAAFGSVVSSISMIISAPGIMLLAASTAFSCDWPSYRKLRKFTLVLGGTLSALCLLVAVTPIYDFIVNVLLEAPEELVEPGRIGLLCLVPFSLAVSYRRFQQGAMIRSGHSNIVGQVTLIRLVTVGVILTIGMVLKTIPGTLLAGLAHGLGVYSEAIFSGVRVRKILPEIKAAPPVETVLTLKRFIRFYIPLALTSSLTLLFTPLISAAVSRMPDPIESLAIWSVVMSFIALFRTPGMAYKEVVVALLKEPGGYPALRRFAKIASIAITAIVIVVVATPLSNLWFTHIANLAVDDVVTARIVMAIEIPIGLVMIFTSLFQGIVVSFEGTGVIAEAVVVFITSLIIILIIGVITESYKGVFVAAASLMFAYLMQMMWLMWRSRKQRRALAIGE